MSQKEDFHHAHATKLLNYGHLGTLTYDEKERTWETLRIVHFPSASSVESDGGAGRLESAFPFQHLRSQVVYGGVLAEYCRSTGSKPSRIPDSDAECCAGTSESSPSDTDVMHDLTNVENPLQCDTCLPHRKYAPNGSSLLAFGSACMVDRRVSKEKPFLIPIAASVSGRDAQSVRLVVLTEETTALWDKGHAGASVHIPSMCSNDEIHWTGHGGPVQQICFATTLGYSSSWMAVRSQSSTTILHPLANGLRAFRCPERRLLSRKAPSLSLNANSIFTVPISRTGGHSHADIAFHPQDHFMFALVDDHGTWTVWLIDCERPESPNACFRVSLVFSGRLWTWDHEKRLSTSRPYHDGWHRVLWCKDSLATASCKLLLCNRRTAAFYDTGGNLLALADLRLGSAVENQCILDAQSSLSFRGHCFVLTSTRLFWLSFIDEGSENDGAKGTPRLLLAWQHFRDVLDTTLHLVLYEMDSATIVLVASRLVDLVSVFVVGLSNGSQGVPASLVDPTFVALPKAPHPKICSCRPAFVLFRSLEARPANETVSNTTKLSLAKLFSVYEDLTVVEHLYSNTAQVSSSAETSPLSPVLPLSACVSSCLVPSKSRNEKALDDFIVPDGCTDGDCALPAAGRSELTTLHSKGNSARPAKSSINWQDVYNHLVHGNIGFNVEDQASFDTSISEVLDHVSQSKSSGIHLLSEFLSSKMQTMDVDHDSEHFQNLVSTFDTRSHLKKKKIRRLPLSLSAQNRPSSLVSIYDEVIETQLTPLSAKMPDRVRVGRERLARSIAVDLLVATTAVSDVPQQPTDSFVRETASDAARSHGSNDPAVLIPPTSSLPQAQVENASDTSIATDDPALTRLRLYTEVNPQNFSPISSNPTLTSILRHLPVSADVDPFRYDYQATVRALAAEEEEAVANAAAQADPRIKKEAEKARIAKERREKARLKAAQEIASSQRAPTIMSSQNVRPSGESGKNVQSSQISHQTRNGFGNSSQGDTSFLLTSQPDRTAFPHAPDKGGKGKKRAAGF